MSPKYQLLMFDFDGTLADSFPWLIQVADKISEKYNLPFLESQQIEDLRNTDGRDLIHLLKVPFWKIPLIAGFVRQMAEADAHRIPLFDGTCTMLKTLSEWGVILAMVSSNSQEAIRRVLGPQADLFSFFECGVSISGKEARIARVLKQSKIPAGKAILIGDEIRDIEAARKAGVASGAVSWGYNRPQTLAAHHPTEIFQSFDDLLGKIIEAAF
jgi:phosphoglycolate phosphatase